jgi:hypothetical protein
VLLPQTEWGHFGPLEQPEAVAGAIVERLLGAEPEPVVPGSEVSD